MKESMTYLLESQKELIKFQNEIKTTKEKGSPISEIRRRQQEYAAIKADEDLDSKEKEFILKSIKKIITKERKRAQELYNDTDSD